MRRPPVPTLDQLRAHRDLTSDLHQWAPTVHRLVCERIDALAEAHGGYEHPLESGREHAERVLAKGQYPFPPGASLYDDLNCNVGYDHVQVGYEFGPEGGARITFTGWYPQWADDGESYERRKAEIYCPAWLLTDPQGEERYRTETAEQAAAVRLARQREDAEIDELIRRAVLDAEEA